MMVELCAVLRTAPLECGPGYEMRLVAPTPEQLSLSTLGYSVFQIPGMESNI